LPLQAVNDHELLRDILLALNSIAVFLILAERV
jgi:hypothetical protein